MADYFMRYEESKDLYQKIVQLISSRKQAIATAMNSAMVFLYWDIGQMINQDVLNNEKARLYFFINGGDSLCLEKNYNKEVISCFIILRDGF